MIRSDEFRAIVHNAWLEQEYIKKIRDKRAYHKLDEWQNIRSARGFDDWTVEWCEDIDEDTFLWNFKAPSYVSSRDHYTIVHSPGGTAAIEKESKPIDESELMEVLNW